MGAEDTGEAAAEPAGLARPTAGSSGRPESAPQLRGLVSGGTSQGCLGAPGTMSGSQGPAWYREGMGMREWQLRVEETE